MANENQTFLSDYRDFTKDKTGLQGKEHTMMPVEIRMENVPLINLPPGTGNQKNNTGKRIKESLSLSLSLCVLVCVCVCVCV